MLALHRLLTRETMPSCPVNTLVASVRARPTRLALQPALRNARLPSLSWSRVLLITHDPEPCYHRILLMTSLLSLVCWLVVGTVSSSWARLHRIILASLCDLGWLYLA